MNVKKDIPFFASKMNTFFEFIGDPDEFFERYEDGVLPESRDLRLVSAALYLLGDCYLRGMGIKIHPNSKSTEDAIEVFNDLYYGVLEEIEGKEHKYPKLQEIIGRGKAAIEIEWLVDGYSRWDE